MIGDSLEQHVSWVLLRWSVGGSNRAVSTAILLLLAVVIKLWPLPSCCGHWDVRVKTSFSFCGSRSSMCLLDIPPGVYYCERSPELEQSSLSKCSLGKCASHAPSPCLFFIIPDNLENGENRFSGFSCH